MIIFILNNEDNEETVETDSSEGVPHQGDGLADQSEEGENTEEQTEQEQENIQQTETSETVDYSSDLDTIQKQIDELTSYSFASCLLLSLIFLFSVIKSLFSGFR